MGCGDAVGVGRGMRSFWLRVSTPQSEDRLFKSAMLFTVTLNANAIELQVSPSFMVYSTGGSVVEVGAGVGESVGVGLSS